jgi:hypothetical protein
VQTSLGERENDREKRLCAGEPAGKGRTEHAQTVGSPYVDKREIYCERYGDEWRTTDDSATDWVREEEAKL